MYEKGNEPSPVPWFLETGILGKEASGGGRKERARDDGGRREREMMEARGGRDAFCNSGFLLQHKITLQKLLPSFFLWVDDSYSTSRLRVHSMLHDDVVDSTGWDVSSQERERERDKTTQLLSVHSPLQKFSLRVP